MLKWLRKQMQQMTQQDGLTLIELIVVVAIIAILAFTITPRVLDALDNSKKNGARSVANEIHSGLERFYANKGTDGAEHYPTELNATTLISTYAHLRSILADTVSLTSNTDNVMTDFTYVPQLVSSGGAITAAALTNKAQFYCFQFKAKDKVTTHFTVSPHGIDENAGSFIACPTTTTP